MPNPTFADNFVPVIDVSRHQGIIDFTVMRRKNIRGVILRASHGQTRDDRVERYYHDALAAGFDERDIGFYSFINPKRGSALETAQVTAEIIKDVTGGRDDVLYMLDVEDYKNEPPNTGTSPLAGTSLSAYVRDHRLEFQRLMTHSFVIAYTNHAYWDSPSGPRDAQHAAELEWIVPRYPLFSFDAYERHGFPPEPARWPEYAFGIKSEGPLPPAGSVWSGWQFSAGFNRQGQTYGCESRDLDLNFVLSSAWDRWTRRDGSNAEQQEESDMQWVGFFEDPSDGEVHTYVVTGGIGKHLSPEAAKLHTLFKTRTVGSRTEPLGKEWQDGVAILDGPLQNVLRR